MNYEVLLAIVVNLVLLVIGYTKLVAQISKFLAEQEAREKAQKIKDADQDKKQKEIDKDLIKLDGKIDEAINEFRNQVVKQSEKHSTEIKEYEKQRLDEITKANANSKAILDIVTVIKQDVAIINNTANLKNEEFDKRINKLESNSEKEIKPTLRGRPRGK